MHQLESLPDGVIELLAPAGKSLPQRIYAKVKSGKIYSCQVSTSGKIEQVEAAQPRPLSAFLWRPKVEGGALTFWYVLGPNKGLFQQDLQRCTAGPCSTSTPPDCVNTAEPEPSLLHTEPEPSLLLDHNGGDDRSQQRNHVTTAETTSFDEVLEVETNMHQSRFTRSQANRLPKSTLSPFSTNTCSNTSSN